VEKSAPRAPKKVRYAVVGLGHIAQVAVLPAFAHARRNSRLAALVSGDAEKLHELGQGTVRTARYDEYDALLASGDIDAVYIALPNHLHCDFAVRAAQAGVHVLCEKPLALSSGECERMIDAAEDAGVLLMTAYRLHFDRANLAASKLAERGRALGEARFFSSVFSMQVREGNVRLDRRKSGGPLYDLGVYCINAARMMFGAEPTEAIAVRASGADPRFAEVDETVSAVLRFPEERLASFTCCFGAADTSHFRVVGTHGDLVLEPAYDYAGSLVQRLTVDGKTRTQRFPRGDQFAPELLYFSDCLLNGAEPEPSGLEGLCDVQVIEALVRSADSGSPVALSLPRRSRRPGMEQATHRPPVREPQLVHAQVSSSR
jgi:predicted dehydrogenase